MIAPFEPVEPEDDGLDFEDPDGLGVEPLAFVDVEALVVGGAAFARDTTLPH